MTLLPFSSRGTPVVTKGDVMALRRRSVDAVVDAHIGRSVRSVAWLHQVTWIEGYPFQGPGRI